MLLCGDTWWTQQYSVILINEILDCYVFNFIIVSNISVVVHTTKQIMLALSCWHFSVERSLLNVALRACIMTSVSCPLSNVALRACVMTCIMSTVKLSMFLVLSVLFLQLSRDVVMTDSIVNNLQLSRPLCPVRTPVFRQMNPTQSTR